jgi:hypothetical protein
MTWWQYVLIAVIAIPVIGWLIFVGAILIMKAIMREAGKG